MKKALLGLSNNIKNNFDKIQNEFKKNIKDYLTSPLKILVLDIITNIIINNNTTNKFILYLNQKILLNLLDIIN